MTPNDFQLQEYLPELLKQLPVTVTVLDLEGRVLFYCGHVPSQLDRKPEYLGRDIREFHKPGSNEKIEAFLKAYRQGSREHFDWVLERDGKGFAVRVAPLIVDEQCRGLLHVVSKFDK